MIFVVDDDDDSDVDSDEDSDDDEQDSGGRQAVIIVGNTTNVAIIIKEEVSIIGSIINRFMNLVQLEISSQRQGLMNGLNRIESDGLDGLDGLNRIRSDTQDGQDCYGWMDGSDGINVDTSSKNRHIINRTVC